MKFLALSIIAATTLIMVACGSEEPTPDPPPLPAPTQVPTADVQATVEAGVQATVVAANLRATAEAESAPTDTPVPEPTATPVPTDTPVPPTNTPVPTDTPVPPTNTPVPPTSTPEPTATPEPPTSTPEPEPTADPATSTPIPTATNTPKPTLTPTATPLPYGLTWDNPVPIGESFLLQNNEGVTLRVRTGDAGPFWARDAWELIDDEHPLNDSPPHGYEYLLITIQVKGHPDDANEYDASARLTVEADPSIRNIYPNDGIYHWLGSNHCGGQVDTVIPRDFSLERYTGEENGRRGFICFIVTHDDSGKVVLVDNGGPGAPPEDRRYFSLRRGR